MELKHTLAQMNSAGRILGISFAFITVAALLLLALSIVSVYGTRGYVSDEVRNKEISTGTNELIQLKKAEQKNLSTYQWADKKSGKVQIPVKRAMDILKKEAQ